jgi:GDP-L-fucose synthase
MTKRMMYIGQQSLAKQYGLKFLTVVPSTLYGPDYHIDGKQMHFIFDLAWKILSCKYFDDDIVLWGDGNQRREIVFLDDFSRDLFLLEKVVENDVVNIGANIDFSIREFADILCDLIGVDSSKIQYDTSKYVGSKVKRLCTKKEESLLGKLERTDLKVGLSKMLSWLEPKFVEYKSKSRKIN